jgi:pyridoxine 5-phosphate synthase
MRRLTVALDALAALRDTAGVQDADLCAAAILVELAGADGVALSLAEEGPGPGEDDVRELRRVARGFELHMAPTQPLLKLALEVRPERVVLASLDRDERGSRAPLDFRAWGASLAPVARTLLEAGIAVAALVRPELDAVKAAHAADLGGVDLWTAAVVDLPGKERAAALERLGDAARLAAKLRLDVAVTGGLGPRTLPDVLGAAPAAERVVVGRGVAARALLVGLDRAIRDLREHLG